ncbi:MAG: hypothetical protein HQL55_15060 [Magnetococcales bacterium]|nr:hypothetical protein [Magnetococcales bacterium]
MTVETVVKLVIYAIKLAMLVSWTVFPFPLDFLCTPSICCQPAGKKEQVEELVSKREWKE